MARTKEQAKKDILCYPQVIYTSPESMSTKYGKDMAYTTLELGSGNGRMLRAMAMQHPDQQYWGIEMKEERCLRLAKGAKQDGSTNIQVYCGPFDTVQELLLEHPVDELWITFPDPWPKHSQEVRRFITYHTYKLILDLVKPGGKLVFKTDHQQLFEYTYTILRHQQHSVSFVTRDLHQSDYPMKEMTDFELRYTTQNLPIYLIEITKDKHLQS